MSEYAWLGVLLSSIVSTLALAAYVVMAVPYFDDAPYLTELRKDTRKALMGGTALFAIFLVIFYLGARHLDEETSGPLLVFAAFIVGLPISLLLGSETWDRYDGHGMNLLPGVQAVAVATGIGLAEIGAFAVGFVVLMQLA